MDHGKIVAHDAPENLKHKYTGTEIDIVCTQIKSLEATLRKRKISYQKDENKLVFHTKKAPTALEILSAHKTTITDFKVKNGTLNRNVPGNYGKGNSRRMNPITAIVQRNLLNYVRSKVRMPDSLFMSMFMLVMFSFLMKSSMSGLDAPMNYLISGVIIMSVFQVSINNFSDILSDISSGYMKEVLVAPIMQTQISMEHILSGAVIAILQGVITMVVGIVLRLQVNVFQIMLLTVVMLVSAMASSAISLFLATVCRNSPALQTLAP